MNVKTLTGLASGLSIAATLISFVDAYFMGSTLSKQQYIPAQVPTYFYLFTVSILCLVMVALSNRKLILPYKDYTDKVTDLEKQLDSHSGNCNEIQRLKDQIAALKLAASDDIELEQKIRAVLMAGGETEGGLVRKLLMDPHDPKDLGRVQSMLGKMEKAKSIEAAYGRFQLVKSF